MGIDIGSGSTGTATEVQDVAVNPTITAVSGNPGDIRYSTATGKIYVKQDSGTTTNWDELAAGTTEAYTTQTITLNATDIANKYIVLAQAPTDKPQTKLDVVGGIEQQYGVDFQVTTDNANKRLSWNGLGLEALLEDGDTLIISYN